MDYAFAVPYENKRAKPKRVLIGKTLESLKKSCSKLLGINIITIYDENGQEIGNVKEINTGKNIFASQNESLSLFVNIDNTSETIIEEPEEIDTDAPISVHSESSFIEDIRVAEEEIKMIKADRNISAKIYLMPIIESALGVLKAYEIASSSDKVCALAVGLEDYTADLGVERTNEGKESFYARSTVVNAAKAAGVQAIDTVFSDINDMEGLRASVVEAKSLGFEGKGCIHPRQIQVVHEAFSPTEKEIEKAKKIVLAFEEAEKKGLGVVALGSKMIDAPVVKRAKHITKLAIINGLLTADWIKREK